MGPNGPAKPQTPQAAPLRAQPQAAPSQPTPLPRSKSQKSSDDSRLNFLDEHAGYDEREPATMLTAVMFDDGAQNRRNFGSAILLIIAIGFAVSLAAMPVWRQTVISRLTEARDDIASIGRYNKKQQRGHGHDVEDENGFGPDNGPGNRPAHLSRRSIPGSAGREPVKPGGSEGCQTLSQMASGGTKMSVGQRTHLAECHLLIDDPSGAEEALKPLRAQIGRADEKLLNAMKANDTLADALLILTQAYSRQGKPRAADDLLSGRCRRWEQTNSCVAKLVVATERKAVRYDSEGMALLFGSRGRLDGKAQARLWLAGAQLALDAGKPQTADQRYDLALQAAPLDALSLRKQIFEAEAIDLYHRGEALRLKRTVVQAMNELAPLTKGAKLKLQILFELSATRNKAKTVQTLLSREDVSWRARGDFDLIEILGPESIKTRNEDPYLVLLRHTAERYSAKYKTSGSILKKLVTWEVRALLAKGQIDKVRERVSVYEKSYGKDAWSRHVIGITYMIESSAQRYQVLAAQEFQEAVRLKAAPQYQWEPLLALGLALTRAGKLEQASAVIKDLDRTIRAKGQKYWVDMLKAEWYLQRQTYPSALAILNAWIKAEPGFVTPRRLRLQVFQKMARKAESEQEQGAIDELNRATRYVGSREGLSSPIGVMALSNRPLD